LSARERAAAAAQRQTEIALRFAPMPPTSPPGLAIVVTAGYPSTTAVQRDQIGQT